MTTLAEVQRAQMNWFDPQNKQLFGDVDYKILHSEKTGKPYLARSTYAWTDMFGKKKKLHWRLNPLDDMLKIRPLIDDVFDNLWAVKRWLKEN